MLEIDHLYTEYPNASGQIVKAVQDISFQVPPGVLFTLLGPSGCGKTTTLRSIAGLEKPNGGEIRVDGTIVYSAIKNIFVPPNKRNFGMVFQSYAIWPHMSVFKNASFPLEVGKNKLSKQEIDTKVMRVLTAVGLDKEAGRDATKLSGGQQQRLALARALVMEPKLLLLDEPLSNLDAKLRERMRFELKSMQKEYGLTTIYVTHDQGEALAMSHEIAVIQSGRIAQIGTPRSIYERPENQFVANFVGLSNFINATVLGATDSGFYFVRSALGDFEVSSMSTLMSGDEVLLSIRPEDLQWIPDSQSQKNILNGTINFQLFLGEFLDYQIQVGNQEFLARVHPSTQLTVGSNVKFGFSPSKCIALK
jgi:iron(III) transport system ATP-binding protein